MPDLATRLESNAKTVDPASGSNYSISQEHCFNKNDATRQIREFWLETLPEIEPNPIKCARHRDCCKHAWFVRNKNTGEIRVRYSTCGYRFCVHCVKHLAAVTREKLMQVINTAENLKFITLTLRNSSDPLKAQLDLLKKSFRRLRQQKVWKARKGYGVIEITYNSDTDTWHPHLHIIADSDYMPKQDLVEAWRKASGGSFIVDIKAIRDKAHAVNYLTSYMAKMDSKDANGNLKMLSWPKHRTKEWYNALHYRRLVLKFGNWPQLPEAVQDNETDNDEIWEIIGTLEELLKNKSIPIYHKILVDFGFEYLLPENKENTS